MLTISDMILSEKCGKFEMHGLHFWAVRIILENSFIKFKINYTFEIDKHGKGPIKWTNHQLYVQNVNLKSTTSF